jgi:hypothetical protein
MKILAGLQGKYLDLAASNMSTTLRVLKCCREPGGVCEKRTGRPSLAKKKNLKIKIHCSRPENH